MAKKHSRIYMDDSSAIFNKRRLIPRERKVHADLQMNVQEISPDTVINDALQTIAIEVTRYRSKVGKGTSLDVREARVLQGYIKAMCELSREQRERERSDQLDKLSTEELVLIAKKVLNSGEPSVVAAASRQSDIEAEEQDNE